MHPVHNLPKDATALNLHVSATSSISPYDTAVRLIDGGTGYPSSGIAEVYLNKQWGAMCVYTIGGHEAATICQQLGYTTTVGYGSTQSPSLRYLVHVPLSMDDNNTRCVSLHFFT